LVVEAVSGNSEKAIVLCDDTKSQTESVIGVTLTITALIVVVAHGFVTIKRKLEGAISVFSSEVPS
jgi:hypothetical protein